MWLSKLPSSSTPKLMKNKTRNYRGYFGNSSSRNGGIDETATDSKLLATLADYMGFKVSRTTNGELALVPKSLYNKNEEHKNFLDYFDVDYSVLNMAENRDAIYMAVDSLDANMVEIKTILDTYSNEVVEVDYEGSPIEIHTKNKSLGEELDYIYKNNKLYSYFKSIVRNLCKYGDMAIEINIGEQSQVDKSNIFLRYRNPKTWNAESNNIDTIVTRYKDSEKYKSTIKDKNRLSAKIEEYYYPWEFVQVSLRDVDSLAYGKSIIQNLISIADKLLAMDNYIALERQSRFDRLVIKVPTTSDNPTVAFNQIQNYRNQFQDVIFNQNEATNSYNRIPSLTDILWIPATPGFEATKLTSGLPQSNVDDVKYYRNKLIAGSGIPLDRFEPESNANRTGESLKVTNKVFAKNLVPICLSIEEGLTILSNLLGIYLGYDMSKEDNKVEVRLVSNVDISNELIDSYGRKFDFLNRTIEMFDKLRGFDPESIGQSEEGGFPEGGDFELPEDSGMSGTQLEEPPEETGGEEGESVKRTEDDEVSNAQGSKYNKFKDVYDWNALVELAKKAGIKPELMEVIYRVVKIDYDKIGYSETKGSKKVFLENSLKEAIKDTNKKYSDFIIESCNKAIFNHEYNSNLFFDDNAKIAFEDLRNKIIMNY